MNYNSKEVLAFKYIKERYNNNYDELVDALYQYMHSYMNGYDFDVCMFADEIENLAGFRNHEDIINYILKYYS